MLLTVPGTALPDDGAGAVGPLHAAIPSKDAKTVAQTVARFIEPHLRWRNDRGVTPFGRPVARIGDVHNTRREDMSRNPGTIPGFPSFGDYFFSSTIS